MHIPQPKFNSSEQLQIIDDLAKLIQQPTATQQPPCPNCTRANINPAECSSNCENAAEALSEDPVQHPIEPNIVPLVFELSAMRLVQTCWSCEGHASADGSIFKMPQISFYAEKPFYAQLINLYLKRIHWHKKIQYPWEVCLSDFGQTLEITYTIKCDLSCIEQPRLEVMQSDLRHIGENFSENIKQYAHELIINIKKSLPTYSNNSMGN